MLGKPKRLVPVLTNSLAGPWLKTSVTMLLTMHTSSTVVARCGSSSLNSAPHCAVAGELAPGAQQLGVPLDEGEPLVLGVRGGHHLAVELLQFGLIVEQLQLAGPAGHEQEHHLLGPRRKWGARGSSGSSGSALAAARPSSANSEPSASAPRLKPAVPKNWRRVPASTGSISTRGSSRMADYSRVMNSSRFNNTRASIVKAAASAGATFDGALAGAMAVVSSGDASANRFDSLSR